jgi:hypothetical protein
LAGPSPAAASRRRRTTCMEGMAGQWS